MGRYGPVVDDLRRRASERRSSSWARIPGHRGACRMLGSKRIIRARLSPSCWRTCGPAHRERALAPVVAVFRSVRMSPFCAWSLRGSP